jgi:cytochrome c-type biogenesis protein CcmH/NrfF
MNERANARMFKRIVSMGSSEEEIVNHLYQKYGSTHEMLPTEVGGSVYLGWETWLKE